MVKLIHSPRKVLFVSHSENLQGGAESSLVELLKSAKSRGYEPYLIVPAEGEMSSAVRAIGIECVAIKFFRWSIAPDLEKISDFTAVARIAEVIKNKEIDCVISNTLMVPWGALAAAMTNAPHVWVAREFFAHHREYLQSHYDFIGAYSNLVIANSKSNAEFLHKTAGIKSAKFFHSYVDIGDIHLAPDSEKSRLVCIGIIHPDKNQLEVLRAIAELKQNRKLLPFDEVLFFGRYREDEYFEELKSFTQQNELEGVVSFAGFTQKPYEKISPNDILVQPSKHESLGRTITESMKLGLITVGADISGTREAIGLGGGYLYKSGDHKGLASLLGEITSDIKKYRDEAKVHQRRALKNLSEAASHGPFFDAIEKSFGQANPRKELRHLLPHFTSLTSAEKKIKEYRKLADSRRQSLDDIINSKAWRAVLAARKVKTVPRNLMRPTGKINKTYFVYLDKKKYYGSTVMRVQQLAEIAQQHVKGKDIFVAPLSADFKNSNLLLTKWALEGLNVKSLAELKAKNNRLIFDPVDAHLTDDKAKFADIIVAASRTALEDYTVSFAGKKVYLVDHHPDPRLKDLDWSKKPSDLQIGYFGELVNTFSTAAIKKRVDFVQVATNLQDDSWLNKLPSYNMHYAVRQTREIDYHKPFLKGFTAAHCGSNMLIQDSQKEAVAWLGKDYPYLLKGEVTEKKVLEMLDYIKDTFGSTEWKQGLEIMATVRKESSEQAIGKQLVELFNNL